MKTPTHQLDLADSIKLWDNLGLPSSYYVDTGVSQCFILFQFIKT
jgi:hypothetical protein